MNGTIKTKKNEIRERDTKTKEKYDIRDTHIGKKTT